MEPQAPLGQRSPVETPNPLLTRAIPPAPPKKSRKTAIILLVVLLLLAGGGAAAYLKFFRKSSSSQVVTSHTTTITTGATKTPTTPSTAETTPRLLFVKKDTTKKTSQLYWQSLDEGAKAAPVDGITFGDNLTVTQTGIYKNEVFVVTEDSKLYSQVTMWYSNDSGKTFSTLFVGTAGSPNLYADTITSAVFSHDGSRIVFSYISKPDTPSAALKTSVKEINPENKSITTLFAMEQAVPFVQDYDSKAKIVWYTSGCYFCDGNTDNKLLKRDVALGKDSPVYTEDSAKTNQIVTSVVVSTDGSKILRIKAKNEMLGGSPPYVVDLFDTATDSAKTLYTTDATGTDSYPQIGMTSDGRSYYVANSKLFILDDTGTPMQQLTAALDIWNATLVSKDLIVAKTGTAAAYKVVSYDVSLKKTTQLLAAGDETTILGVAGL